MKIKKFIKVFIKIVLLNFLFFGHLYAKNINIALCSNMHYVLKDLIIEYNKLYPNTKVIVTLGSSGKLSAQIKHHASYDIFMSANMQYPQALYEDNLSINKPRIYAKGNLVYFSKQKLDFTKGIDILQNSHIKKIAIANPKTAPYGKATLEAIQNAGIYKDISKKLVYASSISQTVSYTLLATDIGIIAKSALFTPYLLKYKENIHWKDVDKKLYTSINQGMIILKNTKNLKEANSFYDFILSKNSKTIFKKFGYKLP